ncbi:MAG: hypothetical protein ABI863_05425 [Ginsengibacter sp.]
MGENNQQNFIVSTSERLSILKIQGSVLPFTEKPSDKHNAYPAECVSDKIDSRINPLELFSLFTADVIKKKVVYIR